MSGLQGGEPLLTFRANWYLTRDVEPAWDLRDTGWHVLVEGDTPLDVDIRFPVAEEDWAATSPGLDRAPPGQRRALRLRRGTRHPHDGRTATDHPEPRVTVGRRECSRRACVTTVAVVVGNPKPRSRTLEVASRVADAAADATGLEAAERITVDLADLGPQLFDWGSSEVRTAVDAVRNSTLAVVASPTYKASYTGLLKSFLDWFSTTDLLGVTVIPVMVGAGRDHALAVEVHLRPVLVELGGNIAHPGPLRHRGHVGRHRRRGRVSGWSWRRRGCATAVGSAPSG